MSKIISLSPVTLTITIRPKPDGTAGVESRCDPPEFSDLLMLSQAMLGLITAFLQQVQSRGSSRVFGLVGKTEGKDDGA